MTSCIFLTIYCNCKVYLPQQVRAGISRQFFIMGPAVQKNSKEADEQWFGMNDAGGEILLHTFP
jgi:hypothetical protein